jgi:hypothetical protein
LRQGFSKLPVPQICNPPASASYDAFSLFFFFFFVVLWIKPSSLHMLGKCSTNVYHWATSPALDFFETGSH